MYTPLWVWIVVIVGFAGLVLFDLLVVARRPHAVTMREATLWVALHVSLAALFGCGVWYLSGSGLGEAFFAGYVTEYSLSVDNLFVFVLIFNRFAVPARHQQRVLLIGIVLSLVMRGAFIIAGAAAINAFDWIFYILGALLVYTAIRLIVEKDDESGFEDSKTVRLMRRVVPTSKDYDGARMITTVDGRRMLTPMVVVILAIGVANVIFALDSIPAIFGLTQDAFIVFTANAFALMGLRHLFFIVDRLLRRLVYLNYGLAAILAFIGVKLILEALEGSHVESVLGVPLPHIGITLSLGFIVVALGVTTTASLIASRLGEESG